MPPTLTYPKFLIAVKGYSPSDIASFVKDTGRYFRLFPEYTAYASQLSGTYIFSYEEGKYLYIDDTLARLAGKSIPYILDNGLGPKEKLWHDPDQVIHNEKVFVKNLTAFKNVPAAKHGQYLIKCNYRINHKSGELRNMLQQSFFIRSAEDRTPLVTLGFVSDISEIRNDNRIVHSVCDRQGQELFTPDVYYARDSGKKLTAREIEVLQLAKHGLSSKEIADRLYIATKTVENHKQNIREKTGTENITQSIIYALQQGYIS